MKHRNVPALTVLALLALCTPVLAEAEGGDPHAIWNLALIPALVLLAAFPAAMVLRLTTRLPVRVAEEATGNGALLRLLGLGNIVAVLAIAGGAKAAGPVIVVLGVILLVLLALETVAGLSVVAVKLGRQLFPDRPAGEGPGAFALGWLLLAGISLLPILGALYLLYWMSWGIGAVIMRAIPRPGPEAPDPQPERPPDD